MVAREEKGKKQHRSDESAQNMQQNKSKNINLPTGTYDVHRRNIGMHTKTAPTFRTDRYSYHIPPYVQYLLCALLISILLLYECRLTRYEYDLLFYFPRYSSTPEYYWSLSFDLGLPLFYLFYGDELMRQQHQRSYNTLQGNTVR